MGLKKNPNRLPSTPAEKQQELDMLKQLQKDPKFSFKGVLGLGETIKIKRGG